MLSGMFALAPLDPSMEIGAQILGFAIAIVLHEVAHGYVALRLGDPTAQLAGRLSLNPIKHIDPFGSIILPIMMILLPGNLVFGWAKPVPVNYYNLRKGKYGPVLVALAGPATNLVLLAFFAFVAGLAPAGTALPSLFLTIALINGVLMFFNLIPIPPLDGSKVLYLFLDNRPDIIQWLEKYSFLLIILLVFVFRDALFWLQVPVFVLVNLFSGGLLF